MARRRMRSKSVAMGSVVALAVLFGACGEEEQVYCVDENDEVVDNDQCDENRSGGGAFFWYFGGRALAGGAVSPGTRLTGGGSDAKVSPSDTKTLNDRGFGSSARSSARSSGIGGTAKTGGFSLGGGS